MREILLKKIQTSAIAECENTAEELNHNLLNYLHNIEEHTEKIAKIAETHEIESEKYLSSFGYATMLFGLLTLVMIWSSSSKIVKKITLIAQSLKLSNTLFFSASKSLKEDSESLTNMSNEQVSGVQNMVSALEEIHSMSKRNTEQTDLSLDKTKSSKEIALSGQEGITEVVKAMHDIELDLNNLTKQIEDNNEKMHELANVISQISVKTNIINDIVFQTKLLSFNASVEAARAGEQGKGFAVVAEEIGSLAELSGKSADEIKQIIDQSTEKVNAIISESSHKTSNLIVESKNKIESGTIKVNQCSTTFEKVVSGVSELNQFVNEIAVASKEQSEGVRSISESIKEIDTSTYEVSRISKVSNSTSSDLLNEANKLQSNSQSLTLIISKVITS